jgi:acyl carrier protein
METESEIAAIWAEVLGLESVDREDNFFELGGSSLQATRMAVRVSERYNVGSVLRILFAHPTAQSFAEQVQIQMLLNEMQ